MKSCTQCGEPKADREFPYDANYVCLPCHRINAMNWQNLPWADGRPATAKEKRVLTSEQKAAMKEGRERFKATIAFAKSFIGADGEKNDE